MKPMWVEEVKKTVWTMRQNKELKMMTCFQNIVTVEFGDKFMDLSVASQLKKLQALLFDGV